MKQLQILIKNTHKSTAIAILENDTLYDFFIENNYNKSIKNNIYKGKVTRIVTGLDAVFVDIGLEKDAFLQAKDCLENKSKNTKKHKISSLFNLGKEIIVQILKDPISSKGAKLTTDIAIASHSLVLLPYSELIGISGSISKDTQRKKLKNIIESLTKELPKCGYIIRTAFNENSEEGFKKDLSYLNNLWKSIQEEVKISKPQSLIYNELAIYLRVIRDNLSEFLESNNYEITSIQTDNEKQNQDIQNYLNNFFPNKANIVNLFDEDADIFDTEKNINKQVQNLLNPKVELKSGAFLIIEQTQALTSIDVNTGKFIGKKDKEKTILKVNLEACLQISYQLKLRKIGGIIVIDFIDMQKKSDKKLVLEELEKYLVTNFKKYKLSPISNLGLVELSIQRKGKSISEIMCNPCHNCNSTGFVCK